MIKLLDIMMRRPCALVTRAQTELDAKLGALAEVSDELTRTVRDALDKTDRRRRDLGHAPERRKTA